MKEQNDDDDDDIFNAIEKQRWDKVIEIIKSKPEEAERQESSVSNNLALHAVMKNQPTIEVVNALLTANPDAIRAKGRWGYLPLHYACTSSASNPVVMRLITMFPGSARSRDDNEKVLPIHLACKWGGANDGVLMTLLTTYPESYYIRDGSDQTPMDVAMNISNSSARVVAMNVLKQGPTLCFVAKCAANRAREENEKKNKAITKAHDARVENLETIYKQELLKINCQLLVEKESTSNLQKELKATKDKLDSYRVHVDGNESRLQKERNAYEERLSQMSTDKDTITNTLQATLECERQESANVIELLRYQLRDEQKKNETLEKEIASTKETQIEKQQLLDGTVYTLRQERETMSLLENVLAEEREKNTNIEKQLATATQEIKDKDYLLETECHVTAELKNVLQEKDDVILGLENSLLLREKSERMLAVKNIKLEKMANEEIQKATKLQEELKISYTTTEAIRLELTNTINKNKKYSEQISMIQRYANFLESSNNDEIMDGNNRNESNASVPLNQSSSLLMAISSSSAEDDIEEERLSMDKIVAKDDERELFKDVVTFDESTMSTISDASYKIETLKNNEKINGIVCMFRREAEQNMHQERRLEVTTSKQRPTPEKFI